MKTTEAIEKATLWAQDGAAGLCRADLRSSYALESIALSLIALAQQGESRTSEYPEAHDE